MQNPKNYDDSFHRAKILQSKGDFVQAKSTYEKVLTQQPKHIAAMQMLGWVNAELGSWIEAVQVLTGALELEPNNDQSYYILGNVMCRFQSWPAGIECFEKALLINPKNSEAACDLGGAYLELKRFENAAASYARAIEINNTYATAYFGCGNALLELKRADEAIGYFDRAIAIQRDYAEAFSNRGNALRHLKRLEEAVASCDRAIAINPDYAQAHSNRGVALKELNRHEEAIASYDRAIAIKPDYAQAYSNRGIALKELNRLEEAIASLDRAIAIKPDYAEAYSNRGNALQALKRLEGAIASYDQAITIKPVFADAYLNKSLTLLLGGQFEEGWALYEWRWKNDKSGLKNRLFVQPLWLGGENIANKTILLHSEQGLGDTIQFCRYAKLVKAFGARVLLEVPKPLLGLLAGLEGVDELLEKDTPLPSFDYHCPLLSFPLAFKTKLNTIPRSSPYLSSDDDKRSEWVNRLGEKRKLRVGLVWSGAVAFKNDHNRSLTLADLLLHLPNDFEYVSLQKEVRERDKGVMISSGLKHFGDHLNDFTDTAALCDLMDVVISVDTSVAHLAGAMGKTTWVLLPYAPDWRWLIERDDSPWYPSVRLYRQHEDRQWEPVLKRVAGDLLNCVIEGLESDSTFHFT